MKKLIAWMLALMLCGGALAEGAAVPGNDLGFKVLARLADGSKNQFVSPVSLAYALSMAAAGAQGETRSELLAALGVEDAADIVAMNEALRESGLSLANAAFVQNVLTLQPGYEAALKRFEARCFPLDGLDEVNDWAREHTNGLIDPLLSDLDPQTRLLLVNAVAMDAEWWRKFDAEDTREGDFHAPDGDIRVDFMHQLYEYADYGEIDGMQVLTLGYRDSDMAMTLALPKEGALADALAALAERGMAALEVQPMDCRVYLALPRLDISVTNLLSGALQALGVRLAFTDIADFSGISDRPLKIDEVLQKLRVQVDEEGTKAAAVTVVMMTDGAAADVEEPVRPLVRMILDRPFIMVISDSRTGAVAFAGVVAAPEAEDLGDREPETPDWW